MTLFTNLQNYSTPPKRICGAPYGNILDAFPVKPISPHDRMGYSFQIEPCNAVSGYSPDICADPSAVKMSPSEYGSEGVAELRVVQAAFKCSTVGATDEELRMHARGPIERNLWRSVDDTLVDMLAADAVASGGPFSSVCALAEAAQYLATNSFCGTGVIYGSTAWVVLLGDHITRDNGVYRDRVGNIIVPSSVDMEIIYAFDSEVEVRASEIQLMDEYAPSIRTVNDRIVRAEQLYTVAADFCSVASFSLTDCA